MFPERSDATRTAGPALSSRLFGVPVPARAFGFAPGWQSSPRCWSTIDLRNEEPACEQGCERSIEDAVRVMRNGMDAVQPLMHTAPAKAKRGAARTYRPSSRSAGAPTSKLTSKTTSKNTTEVEVAAA